MALWYGFPTMRLLVAAVIFVTAACGGDQIHNFHLAWRSADTSVKPSATVGQALSAVPVAFGLRDTRPDPSAVGTDEDSGHVVRTMDNVAKYCSDRFGDMLRNAGARLNEQPQAVLEADLIEFKVDEGGTFKGVVRVRVTMRRAGGPDWSRVYEGTSTRWGRSHSAENFNEALSNALSEATTKLLHDEDFGRALLAPPPSAGT